MRQLALVVLIVMLAVSTATAEEEILRVFVIGGGNLTERFDFTSVNFWIRDVSGDNIWSFNGLRRHYGQAGGFIDAFVGLQFPQGKKGTYALSPRVQVPLGRFYVWHDIEWYLEPGDWYTYSTLQWKAIADAAPGEGLELGIELETFWPGDSSHGIWHGGPFVSWGLNDKLNLSLTWHERSKEYDGDFIRLSETLLFF